MSGRFVWWRPMRGWESRLWWAQLAVLVVVVAVGVWRFLL